MSSTFTKITKLQHLKEYTLNSYVKDNLRARETHKMSYSRPYKFWISINYCQVPELAENRSFANGRLTG